MAKTESTFLNMVVVLAAITLLAGGILGYVYDLTKAPIAKAAEEKQQAAIEAVLLPFDELKEAYDVTLDDGSVLSVIPAYNSGEYVGAAVEATTKSGFSGEIKIMVGFTAEGAIQNYSVLQHAETPGLGSKMQEWFCADKNKQSILGLNPSVANLTVSKDGGDVDAITAATISSRAFLGAVRNAYQAFAGSTDADTGATSKPNN